jgi:hypothetical protein
MMVRLWEGYLRPAKGREELSLQARRMYLMTDNEEHVFAEQHRELSRRAFLAETGRTLSMALASAGVFYEFIEVLSTW